VQEIRSNQNWRREENHKKGMKKEGKKEEKKGKIDKIVD
jgi:hypothetical protein